MGWVPSLVKRRSSNGAVSTPPGPISSIRSTSDQARVSSERSTMMPWTPYDVTTMEHAHRIGRANQTGWMIDATPLPQRCQCDTHAGPGSW